MSGSPASNPPILIELSLFWRLAQFQHVDDDGCGSWAELGDPVER